MTTEHPDDATWERLALHELPRAERTRVLEHALACARCREIYQGLLALEDGARAFDPGVPRARRPVRALWLAGGAMAAVAAALAIWLYPAGPARQTRGGGVQAVTLRAPAEVRSPVDARLDWEPVAGAESYRVELFSADGLSLWTSADVAGPPLAWPAGVAAPPGDYRWKVEARRGGAVVAESPLARLRVTGP